MAEAKRILAIVTQGDWGGVQQYLIRFAHEARRRGHDVMIASGTSDELGARAERDGISFRELKRLVRDVSPIRDMEAIGEIRALIREWRPDIVYLHSSKAGIVGSIAAHREDVGRIVYRIGGWSFLDPVSPFQRWLRRWSERLTANLKDVIITVHPGDEKLAKRYGITPRERVVTIPNGLNINTFDQALLSPIDAREELRRLWNADANAKPIEPNEHVRYVITIANFYGTKDLSGYLDALKAVNKTDLRFLIVGDGEERAAIEEKRKALGLERIVSLPGKKNDVATLLKGADAFVLPSAKEGMPWTVLEAMTAALPIVATEVGACAWMIGEHGWIVEPKQPDAIAEAVKRLFDDYGKARMKGVSARRELERRFTDDAMWEETFRALLP